MDQSAEIKALKDRVAALEDIMDDVKQILGIGRIDEEALSRAMESLLAGDKTALDNYLKRGGKIPRELAA